MAEKKKCRAAEVWASFPVNSHSVKDELEVASLLRKRATDAMSSAELERKEERVAVREDPLVNTRAPPSLAEFDSNVESVRERVELPER